MIMRESENADSFDNGLYSNSWFFIRTGLTSCTTVAIKKFLLLEEHWIKKLSLLFLHRSLDKIKKTKINFKRALFRFPNSCLFKSTSFPSISQSEVFYLFENSSKVDIFLLWSEMLMEQQCQEVFLVLTCLKIQTHIFSALPASFFHQGFSRQFSFVVNF